jgi:hypothetical protein
VSPDQRRQALLAILAVALAAVIYVEWPRAGDSGRNVAGARSAIRAPAAAAGATEAPEVHLKSLDAERTKPDELERNLFKFKPRPAPAAPPRAAAIEPAPVQAVPAGPPPPAPPPPIGLKFIGMLETNGAQRIAILSDGRGAPLYGKEGDTVLGQYKILHIGVESIEMAYLDGRGRQTIRLSGS